MTTTKDCDERHAMVNMFLRALVVAVITAFASIFSAYLYAGAMYAEKEDVEHLRDSVKEMRRELREDIKAGFARIEKQLGP